MARRKYTLTNKLEALKLLKLNDFNYYRTSKDMDLDPKTLRTWADDTKLMDQIDLAPNMELREKARKIDKQIMVSQEDYVTAVFKAKKLVIERMVELVETTRDISKLAAAFNALRQETATPDMEGAAAKKTSDFMAIMKQTFIDNNKGEESVIKINPSDIVNNK